ncbi:hypothetical protein FPK15_contig00021-0032 [Flavobacterium psychrophilum]|nr:hypothetical protein FPK15_contig00021-0032 [Flavobacterium psychrophilum]
MIPVPVATKSLTFFPSPIQKTCDETVGVTGVPNTVNVFETSLSTPQDVV